MSRSELRPRGLHLYRSAYRTEGNRRAGLRSKQAIESKIQSRFKGPWGFAFSMERTECQVEANELLVLKGLFSLSDFFSGLPFFGTSS